MAVAGPVAQEVDSGDGGEGGARERVGGREGRRKDEQRKREAGGMRHKMKYMNIM